jgi:hypothetical protein
MDAMVDASEWKIEHYVAGMYYLHDVSLKIQGKRAYLLAQFFSQFVGAVYRRMGLRTRGTIPEGRSDSGQLPLVDESLPSRPGEWRASTLPLPRPENTKYYI